ncbi:MAG TPA: magnesium transporter CorA family protein [Steroidobacteraceae bacterium]|nr:magnesium transporter CorA family protein [Steroidobacteraceae bacterium]
MLSAFLPGPAALTRLEPHCDAPLPQEALWFDLREPTPEDERRIETAIGVGIPTREEMREIESSNRLYEEDGALFMTATVVTKLDTDLPESTQITFILAGKRLVTVRYVDPLPFRRFIAYAERHMTNCHSGATIFAGLLEAIINRIADVIERAGAALDAESAGIFAHTAPGRRATSRDFRGILERLGQNGELLSKSRESLVSLGRLLAFAQQQPAPTFTPDVRSRFRMLSRDVLAMSDHVSYLAAKVQFLLEATLGMVNIEQNAIIKIFSVAAVVFLPPTLVASIYGMNFHHMPELDWLAGYPFAIGLMVLSAVLPYLWFKRKGWL